MEQVEARRQRRERITKEFFDVAHSPDRYKLIQVIGEGAYGVVCSAEDRLNGNKTVAIKRIRKVMATRPMAIRILRELKFLRLLRGHENIISVLDVLVPSQRLFDDTFVVFEHMPTDLRRLLRSRTELNHDHIKYLLFQIMRGVGYLHSAKVFHRDLKPDNLLVNSKCELKICDFGLARAAFEGNQDQVFFTDYVATRWYRAPELITSRISNYSTAIDMWSVGCIFAEILSKGKPLFPGNNVDEQFALILEVTGRPSDNAVAQLRHSDARNFLESLPQGPRRPLREIFRDSPPLAVDLLQQLLEFDPDRRISAAEALRHEYFRGFRNMIGRNTREPLPESEFNFERRAMAEGDMRNEFLEEIRRYHPDVDFQAMGYTQSDYAAARFDRGPVTGTMPESRLRPVTEVDHFNANVTMSELELANYTGRH
mmetsp:Transcript_575/g.1143  ORF Transcript_575/g.1143 Transcript_575/m.1143 type:complete len:427 (-) Transcript_575:289-1569(-)